MATRRNALGRGLGALIPEPTPAQPPPPSALVGVSEERVSTDGVSEIPIERIDANPHQPRRIFDSAEIEQLSQSIQRHGLLQPVVVRAVPETSPQRYELVVGERRWRASKLAGLERLPATIKDVAPQELLEIALVENVQRQDLNPIELALAFRTLVDAGSTQEQVGARVGLDRSSVANHIRLLDLPRELQEDVETGALSVGHAKALLQLANPERRRHLRDRIVGEQLSVRASEELARSLAGPGASRRKQAKRQEAVDPNLRHLVDSLRDHLKTKVRIQGSPQRGTIEIEFYGPEELNRITSALLSDPHGL